MDTLRKPFEGVLNIIRFNWHFYLISAMLVSILIITGIIAGGFFENLAVYMSAAILMGNFISLFASWYIYDKSDLYKFNWLKIEAIKNENILNIHAGFDETSKLLLKKFPNSNLTVFDFYDPLKHTEVSIKRARKAYPPFPNTLGVNTSELPAKDKSIDLIFATLAVHEIRNQYERDAFFKELWRILKPDGKIIVTEHLRDVPNFLVYNIGFFHFLPKKSWIMNFENAPFKIVEEIKITPFLTSFILKKDGNTA